MTRRQAGPTLATTRRFRASVGRIWPTSTQHAVEPGPSFGRLAAEVGPDSASQTRPTPAYGPHLSETGRAWSRTGRYRPGVGQHCPIPGQFWPPVGRVLAQLGRIWPRLANTGPMSATFCEFGPKVRSKPVRSLTIPGQLWPTSAELAQDTWSALPSVPPMSAHLLHAGQPGPSWTMSTKRRPRAAERQARWSAR